MLHASARRVFARLQFEANSARGVTITWGVHGGIGPALCPQLTEPPHEFILHDHAAQVGPDAARCRVAERLRVRRIDPNKVQSDLTASVLAGT